MIRLTDEEIKKLPKFVTSKITTRPEIVVQAQLKKVAEWGSQPCEHDNVNLQAVRAYCPECWQALLEEIKG